MLNKSSKGKMCEAAKYEQIYFMMTLNRHISILMEFIVLVRGLQAVTFPFS